MCSAAYTILLQKKIGDHSRLRAPMFFGFVGAFAITLLWPMLPILSAANVEPFEWPDKTLWLWLALNGVLGTVLSDLLWLHAVLLTSPTVATVGLSLTIPMAMVADAMLHGKSYSIPYVIGALLVVIGFVLVSIADSVSRTLRPRCEQRCARLSCIL